MKQRYYVTGSETAETDLIAIIEYIAHDSLSPASEVFKG